MSSVTTLAAVVSTTEPRLDNLDRLLTGSAAELNRLDALVVVVQRATRLDLEQRLVAAARRAGVQVPMAIVADPGAGLSRSRNSGLATAATDYVWLLDDDVELVSGAVEMMQEFMTKNAASVYCGRVVGMERGDPYKPYRPAGVYRRLELLRVSSIEMVIGRRVYAKGVRFREQLGLGATLPAGEEAVFLLDAYDRGEVVVHMPFAIAKHPLAGRSFLTTWRDPARAAAQGVVARRVAGASGLALLLRWGWRMVCNGLPSRSLVAVVRGYVNGRRWIGE